jgi:outer membrane receptor protein involved in Fe transport
MLRSAIFAAVVASAAGAVVLDSAAAFAQERPPIRGTVKDATTGKPVPAATVMNQDTGDASVTDDDGSFELPSRLDGPGRLLVIDPSYQTAEVRFDGTAAVAITLDPISLGGEEIVIVAERDRATAGEAAMRREEILRIPGARGDALAAVKNLPGVANTQGFGPSAGIVIRGSSPADSRIFVDGFEIPILYHLGGIQSVLPSEMIDDLVYAPGAFGVELGKASGGTIHVASRKGARELAGFAEVSFINAATMLQGPLGKKGSFAFAARRSYIDALIPLVVPRDGGLAFTALPRYYDYQLRADYELTPDLKLSAFLFGSDDRFAVATDGQDPGEPSRFENTARFTRAIVSATYSKPGRYNKLAVSALTQRTGLVLGDDRFLRVAPDSLAARNEARIGLGRGVALLAGGELETRDVAVRLKLPRPPREGEPSNPDLYGDALIDTTIDRTLTTSGLWAALELQPVGWLKATAGVRIDDFRYNDETVVQPRVQSRVKLSRSTSLLAAGGLYTRPPDHMDENLDPALDPERAWQTSVGIEQQLTRGVALTATAYHIDRSDMIAPAAARRPGMSTDGTGTYVNSGAGRSHGAELLLQARGARYFGWAAYTYGRSERRDRPMDEARLFDSDQTHNLIVLGSVKLGERGAWQLGGRFQLTSGTPYTPVMGAIYDSDRNAYDPEYGRINSRRNPAQHQLDVRLDRSFSFKSWKLSAYLDVANVYVNPPVVGHDYNRSYTERTETTGIPILPSIGVRGEI